MIRYLVAITIVLSSWATTASSAIECSAELPPAPKEYWSWRIIDGKRCWYPGRPGMNKANLRWPQSEPQQLEDVRNSFLPPSPQPKASPPSEGMRPPVGLQPKASQQSQGAPPPNVGELPFAERWPY
jgi:hypothetical protein